MARPRPSTQAPRSAFARIEVRAPDAEAAERLAAEAYAAGAAGLEEREGDRGIDLLVYARVERAEAVAAALRARPADALAVRGPRPEVDIDWGEAWKQGLEAIEISPRLRVRPSWIAPAARPGGIELAIDPGQAFGTGGHPSTRLALEWIDALADEPTERALDVGTGSGVLALAAVALGASRAVAVDRDPVAVREARRNAAHNGLAGRVHLGVGSADALARGCGALVLANLLRTELLPILPELAACARAGARMVVSGLLSDEAGAVSASLAAAGFRVSGSRRAVDAGGQGWVALLTRR